MKKSKENFVHLHVHSDMSQLDGCGKIEDYVKEIAERGSPAIAFTDHGTMRGYYKAHIECEKNNIIPVHGVEFYIANDMHRKGLTDEEREEIVKGVSRSEYKKAIKEYEERNGIRDRWHLTVWAINNKGLRNLFRLTSLSYTDGFYYKPRIDLDTLIKYGEGLAVGTGCVGSIINDHVNNGQLKRALFEADRLYEKFGENFWIEVQPHDLEIQTTANQFALFLKKRYGKRIKLLATQDAHYIHKEDYKSHEVLLCIGTNDYLSNPNHFKFSGDDFFLKTRKQMYQSFRKFHPYMETEHIKEALNSTLLFTEKIQTKLKIDYHAALLPEIEIPKEYDDEFNYIKHLCIEGWTWRKITQRINRIAARSGKSRYKILLEYSERLKYELKTIHKHKFVNYFLVVHDLYKWAREKEIKCGPGRGSAAGCLVSFLLGITSVDPIEHGLMFERFISPGRNDLPDIDMDFEDQRRQEIIDYLFEKYGRKKVAQITTLGKLSGKQVVKDVARTLDVPYIEANKITSCIADSSKGDEDKTVENSFSESSILKEFSRKYPNVEKFSIALEGMTKSLGVHAAGVVVAPKRLTNYLPLETRKHNGKDLVVTALDMKGVAAIGLVKLDVLGLRTLTIIRECVEEIKKYHKKEIDLEHLDLNDPIVLQGFTEHDFAGVFQFDSPQATKICEGVVFDSFQDVVTMNALNRPGTTRSGLAEQFIERKKNPKLTKKILFHKKVAEIAEDTLGVMVFQEHVLKVLIEIAGFSVSEADKLRKIIGKSEGDKAIAKSKDKFIEGAKKKTGLTEEEASKIFKAITKFGSYAFNKSHATAYSITAYWTMYLKKYYPLEFYWAVMKNEPQLIKIQSFSRDAKRHGINILPPDVSVSDKYFSIDRKRNAIRGSLLDIKGVGEKAVETIVENQPYKNFIDFLNRIERRKCHKGVVLSLAKAGALDNIIPNTKWLVENFETFWKALSRTGSTKKLEKILKKSKEKPNYSEEERQFVASKINPLAFGEHPIDSYEKFIDKNLKIKITSTSEEDFFERNDGKSVYIAGVIVKIKMGRIGDFHTGDTPDEVEKERMKWGAQYANVFVENKSGTQNKIKIDYDVFDYIQPIIDSGPGTPIIAHVFVNRQYQNLRTDFIVDLEEFRKKVEAGEKLNIWEEILSGNHPASTYNWKSKKVETEWIENSRFKSTRNKPAMFCGVVTHVKIKFDKRGSEMAFFGLIGAKKHLEVICFGSYWPKFKKKINRGDFLIIELEKSKGGKSGADCFFNGGYIKRLKFSSSKT